MKSIFFEIILIEKSLCEYKKFSYFILIKKLKDENRSRETKKATKYKKLNSKPLQGLVSGFASLRFSA